MFCHATPLEINNTHVPRRASTPSLSRAKTLSGGNDWSIQEKKESPYLVYHGRKKEEVPSLHCLLSINSLFDNRPQKIGSASDEPVDSVLECTRYTDDVLNPFNQQILNPAPPLSLPGFYDCPGQPIPTMAGGKSWKRRCLTSTTCNAGDDSRAAR